MLIRYKKSFEKIAMGLMSFMPTEKDLKKLQSTMKDYEENDSWHLFIWKQDDDAIGIIGMELTDELLTIQHISVNPSHRQLGIGKQMVCALREIYPNHAVKATEHTAAFIDKCDLE